MKTSETRILTTHAGSLPRPKALARLHAARFAGDAVDEDALAAAEAEATQRIVEKQIAAKIDVLGNGEMSRESFFTYVQHRMSGFGGQTTRPIMRDMTRYPAFLDYLFRTAMADEHVNLLAAPRAEAQVAYLSRTPVERECALLKEALKPHNGQYEEAFVTAASPGIVAAAMENAFYPDIDAYLDALADALSTEYKAIVEAGFVLQIDAPDLAMERHTLFADKPLADFLAFAKASVTAINRALEGIPRQRTRLHVCWGNYEGPHDLDVALAEIWPAIADAHAGALMISLANPRHEHEWRCFETHGLPDETLLIAGVIDTTTNYVEHPQVVADRIERLAAAIGDPKRLLAGTDCGFETAAGFGAVVEDIVWAKLQALSDGAALASRRLFA
jgi:5-methyltetrahydropteroyltriglutamate--homocysteine methyltransferase